MAPSFTGNTTCILVTVMMFVMVFFMPLLDQIICHFKGISLADRLSKNPHADEYLHFRKKVLIFIFIIYLILLAYVALFSRSAAKDYQIHVAFYQNFAGSLKIDYGFLGLLKILFTEGLDEALKHVKIIDRDNFLQVYLNVVMFVPMGYLLPYIFDYYRQNIRIKVVITSFLVSLFIENIQLVSKLGYYDVDDLVSNTLGGYIGQLLYVMFAYVLTHPDFVKEFFKHTKWRMKSRNSALSGYFTKIDLLRVTLFACDKEEILDFYENKLGMYLRETIEKYDEYRLFFEMGRNQLEIRCGDKYKDLPQQILTITCNNSEYLKKNLEKHNIEVSEFKSDPYTRLRYFSFNGPDNTLINVVEEH